MIFTQQLGTLEGKTSQEAIKSVANHLRRMQDELEYRLSVLDSSNINEIDAQSTQILMPNGNLVNVIEDQEGNYTELTQTVEGLGLRVGNAEGKVVSLTASVDGLKTRVENTEGKVSEFTQTVDGFRTQVAAYEASVDGYTDAYSELTQTVEGFQTTVSQYDTEVEGYKAQVSTFTQTVKGFQTTVSQYDTEVEGYRQQVSTFQQTADSISASVAAVSDENGEITAASIVMAINETSGSSLVQISADHILFDGTATFYSHNDGSWRGYVDYNAIQIEGGKISVMDQWGTSSNGDIWYNNDDNAFVISSLSSIVISSMGSVLMEGDFLRFVLDNGKYWVLDGKGLYYYNADGSVSNYVMLKY